MNTEILKIIEGGLNKDSQKVLSYAKILIDNLKKEGEIKMAERVLRLINGQKSSLVFHDEIFSAPVDQESRLTMADIIMPNEHQQDLVLAESLQKTIEIFIKTQRHKKELQKKGLDIHSSLLLYGQPGCGKTTIAKYISHELQLPIVLTRFDSLISSLLGNTAKNIRRLFDYANSKPCILFLDEFDAIAKARDDQHELGELKRVINSLLQNIDDFTQNNILIAATNHHELLDRAIWRRFNYIVEVKRPSREEIVELLKLFLRGTETDFLENPKKLEMVANNFADLSHADIKTVCNNALARTVINKKNSILMEDILFQIFLLKKNNSYEIGDLVTYFHNKGLSQNSISSFMQISMRQVVNHLKQ